jgi:hypothetical protein
MPRSWRRGTRLHGERDEDPSAVSVPASPGARCLRTSPICPKRPAAFDDVDRPGGTREPSVAPAGVAKLCVGGTAPGSLRAGRRGANSPGARMRALHNGGVIHSIV